MVLGYSTNAFVKFPLLESFEMIAGLGFKGVEIMCDQPHLYPPSMVRPNWPKSKQPCNGAV
jgi:sugar phosphate isomerase/epimerase